MNNSLTPIPENEKALVLFSGGQDSTTCLYWAMKMDGISSDRRKIIALNLYYGQRHVREVQAAKTIAERIAMVPLITMDTDILSSIGDSAMFDPTKDISSKHERAELPSSFVPGRNLLFLTIAAAIAYKMGIHHIVTGVCQTDYSGYPDCRAKTIEAVESMLRLGLDYNITIHTPLMWLTKSQTVKLATTLPGCMDALTYSHTCYNGLYPPCGKCPACILREQGFKEAGVPDPIYEGTIRTRSDCR